MNYYAVDKRIEERLKDVNPLLLQRLDRFAKAYNLNVQINSAARTAEEQEQLRRSNNKYLVAKGKSKHETGDALDIQWNKLLDAFGGDEDAFDDALKNYGIHRPHGKKDPVHIELLPGYTEPDMSGALPELAIMSQRKAKNPDELMYWDTEPEDLTPELRTDYDYFFGYDIAKATYDKFKNAWNDSTVGGILNQTADAMAAGNRFASYGVTLDRVSDLSDDEWAQIDRTNFSAAEIAWIDAAPNRPEKLARLRRKMEDRARLERVNEIGVGLSSLGTLAGTAASDPLNLLGAIALPRTIASSAISKMGADLTSTVSRRILARTADTVAFAAANAGYETAERMGAEYFAGYDQDYTASALGAAALGGVFHLLTSRDLYKLPAETVQQIRNVKESAEQAVIERSTGLDGARNVDFYNRLHAQYDAPDLIAKTLPDDWRTTHKSSNLIVAKRDDFKRLVREYLPGTDVRNAKAATIRVKDGTDVREIVVLNPENWTTGDTLEGILQHEYTAHLVLPERLTPKQTVGISDAVRDILANPKIKEDHIIKLAAKEIQSTDVMDIMGASFEIIERDNPITFKRLKQQDHGYAAEFNAAQAEGRVTPEMELWRSNNARERLYKKRKKEFNAFFQPATGLTYDDVRLNLNELFNASWRHITDDGTQVAEVHFSKRSPMAVANDVADSIDPDTTFNLKGYLKETADGVSTFVQSNSITGSNYSVAKTSPVQAIRRAAGKLAEDPIAGSTEHTAEEMKNTLIDMLSVKVREVELAPKIRQAIRKRKQSMSFFEFAKSSLRHNDDIMGGLSRDVMDCYNALYGLAKNYNPLNYDAETRAIVDAIKQIMDYKAELGGKSGIMFGKSAEFNLYPTPPANQGFSFLMSRSKVMNAINQYNGDQEELIRAVADYVKKHGYGEIDDNYAYRWAKEHIEAAITGQEVTTTIAFDSSARDFRVPYNDAVAFSMDDLFRDYNLYSIFVSNLNRFAGRAAINNVMETPLKLDDDAFRAFLTPVEQASDNAVIERLITTNTKDKQLNAVRQMLGDILGVNPFPDRKTSVLGSVVQMGQREAYAAGGSNMGLAQLAEMFGNFGISGIRTVMDIIPAMRRVASSDMTRQEVDEFMGVFYAQNFAEVLSPFRDTRSHQFRQFSTQNSGDVWQALDILNTGVNRASSAVAKASMLPQLTEQMVKATRAAAIHDALRWTSGHNFSSWRNPFTKNKLRYIGIAEDQIDDIRARWGKYLHMQKDGVKASEIEARWYAEDKESLMKFYHFMDAQSKRSIQQNTVGATPYLTSASDLSPIFKILLQFRDFTQRALHTVVMRGAHEISLNDLDIGMAMIYSGIGNGMMYALGNQARAWSRWPDDERKRREYLRKVNDPDRIIEAGIIRSNLVSGLTWSATDVYEAVTGRQSTNFYTDRSGSFFTRDIGEAGGDFLESVPAARVLQGVYSAGRIGITAALPNHSVSTKDINNLFAALPFGNFIPLLWVQEIIKDLVR